MLKNIYIHCPIVGKVLLNKRKRCYSNNTEHWISATEIECHRSKGRSYTLVADSVAGLDLSHSSETELKEVISLLFQVLLLTAFR